MKLAPFALLPLLSAIACAAPEPVQVQDAWTRDSAGRTANAAVFMTIRSQAADRLVSASSPVARKTTLMTMVSGRNTMEMKDVAAIDLPAGTTVSLDPSGLHVWLADLKQPLKAGQDFPVVLTFEKAGQRRVVVKIIPAAAPPPATAD